MTIAEQLTSDHLWTRARAMFARAVAAIGDASVIAAITALTPALRRRIVAWLCPLEHIVRKLLLAEAAELRLNGSLNAQFESFRGSAMPRTRNPGANAVHSAPGFRIALTRVRNDSNCTSRAVCAAGAARSNLATPQPGWTAGLPARTGAPASEDCAAGAARSNLETARFSLSLPRDPLAVPDARAPRIRALWGSSPPPPPQPTRAPRTLNEADAPLRLARRFEALRRVLENPRPHAERLARLLARAVRRFPEIARRYLLAPARTGDYDPADSRLSVETLAHAWDAPEAFKDSS